MNRYATQLLIITLVACMFCLGCAHPQKTSYPIPPASKARIDALIDSALQLKENKVECVPYETHKQAVLVSIDIWETYAICVVDREELIQLAAIDLAEMQGKVNTEAARADKNAQWILYTVIGGLVLSALTFGLGAIVF